MKGILSKIDEDDFLILKRFAAEEGRHTMSEKGYLKNPSPARSVTRVSSDGFFTLTTKTTSTPWMSCGFAILAIVLFMGCSVFKKDVVVNVIEEKDYKELGKRADGKPEFVCFTPEVYQEVAKARLGK